MPTIESICADALLLLDVDGTLIDPCGALYPGARYLAEAGRKVGRIALCSARPMASLQHVGELLGGVDILVGLQGAIASRRSYPNYLWAHPLDGGEVSIVRALVESSPIEMWLYDDQQWFCDSLSPAVHQEISVIGTSPIAGGNVPPYVYKIALVDRSSAAATRLGEIRLKLEQQGICCLRTHTHMLEIIASVVGPDKGVSRLRLALGTSIGPVIAIGDGENDIGMLQAADLAFGFKGTAAAASTPQAVMVAPASDRGLFEITDLLSDHGWLHDCIRER